MDFFGLGPDPLTKYNILSSEENLGKCYSTLSGAYMGRPLPNSKTLSNFEKQTKGLDFEGGVKGDSGELYKETPCRNPAANIRKMNTGVLSSALNRLNTALNSAGKIFGANTTVVVNAKNGVSARRDKLKAATQKAANKAAANAAAAAEAAAAAAANASNQERAAALAAVAAAEAAAAQAAKAANNLRAANAAAAAAAKAKLLDYLNSLLKAFFRAFDYCLQVIDDAGAMPEALDISEQALK